MCPFVFSDSLRNEILKLLTVSEKHAPNKTDKDFVTNLRKNVESMPQWRPGQRYDN